MGDMSLPADYPTVHPSIYDEAKLVKLARQIAMGIKELPDILFDNSLTLREFDVIKQLPHFNNILVGEMKAWEGASNTNERLRMKSAALLEEYLPELYARLNDREEPLMAKIKALELASKMAGFSDRADAPIGTPGDKVSVIINLGADHKLTYEKQLPSKVIEHEASPPLQQTFEESLDASANQV